METQSTGLERMLIGFGETMAVMVVAGLLTLFICGEGMMWSMMVMAGIANVVCLNRRRIKLEYIKLIRKIEGYGRD